MEIPAESGVISKIITCQPMRSSAFQLSHARKKGHTYISYQHTFMGCQLCVSHGDSHFGLPFSILPNKFYLEPQFYLIAGSCMKHHAENGC